METFLVSPFFLSLLTLAQAHDEQREQEEDPSSYVQGITVLGLLVLLIVLYRLLNTKREETREIAWKMLSGTISIFAGVVIYTVLNEGYKQLDEKVENKNAPDDSYKMEAWLARSWVFALYALFVCSVSWKACIRKGKDYRMEIVKGGHRHTWLDHLFPRLSDSSTTGRSSRNERFASMLEAAGEILLAEEKHKINHPDPERNELDAGKSSYKSTICSIKGSLFWAHALGFAGIDGWNMSQQQWCCLDDWNSEEDWKCENPTSFDDQIWWSFALIVKQIGMFHVMNRVVGFLWSYVKVRFIEAKHFHLAKLEGGTEKRLTKKTEGSTNVDSWQWKEWKQEEGEDEECDDLEDTFVAFKKTHTREGKVCYVEISGEEATTVCPWPRRGQTITTPTTPLVETPDSIPSFDYAVPVFDEIIELWDDVRKDGENDYFAMSSSFLLVQTLRLALTRTLPNKDEDEEVWKHPWQDSLKLAAFTLFFLFCAYNAYAAFVKAKEGKLFQEGSRMVKCMQYLGDICLWVCVSVSIYLLKSTTKPPKDFHLTWMILSCVLAFLFMLISGAFRDLSMVISGAFPDLGMLISGAFPSLSLSWLNPDCLNALEQKRDTDARGLDIFVNILLLSASWSAMFATEWMLAHSKWSSGVLDHFDGGLLTINVALWVTGVVFLSIWLVDLLLVCVPSGAFDLHETHKGAFDKINTSLGLLIGFVWESEFDKAVEHIADRLSHKIMFKIGAGLGVLFFLLPVWFNSIIPMSEEHGYKFGFVFRRMHARFQGIYDEAMEEGGKGATRSKQHKRHFATHKEHIKEVIKILQRMTTEDDTKSGSSSATPASSAVRAASAEVCPARSRLPGAAAPATKPGAAASAIVQPGAAPPPAAARVSFFSNQKSS